jgi:hypothetical protein
MSTFRVELRRNARLRVVAQTVRFFQRPAQIKTTQAEACATGPPQISRERFGLETRPKRRDFYFLDFHLVSLPLLRIRQCENIQRVAGRRRVDVGQDRSRHISRAAAAESCGDGDILFAADAERDRKALHGGSEPDLPEDLAGVHIDGAEVAVEIADERDASVC